MSKQIEWLKEHWIKIVMGIIILLIIYSIVSFVSKALNCSGPICKGIGDGIGAAASFLDQLTSGCSKQANCPPIGDKDVCNKASGCGWDDSSKPSPTPASPCTNITGQKVGSGGPFTLNCGIFDFALAWLLLPILMSISKRWCSQDIKDAARLSGETVKDTFKKVLETIKELLPEKVSELEKSKDFDGLSPENKKIVLESLGKMNAERTVHIELYESASKDSSGETAKEKKLIDIKADAVRSEAEGRDALRKELEKAGVSEAEAEAAAEEVREGLDPMPE